MTDPLLSTPLETDPAFFDGALQLRNRFLNDEITGSQLVVELEQLHLRCAVARSASGWRKVDADSEMTPNTGYVLSKETRFIVVFDADTAYQYELPPLSIAAESADK
jgi:hypothetical protein